MAGIHDNESRDWRKSFFAHSDSGTMYSGYVDNKSKELFYAHPTKPLLYNDKGELLGFRGADKKFHFHEPEKGWGSLNMDKYKNVGNIVNKYLKKPGQSLNKRFGDYSTVKSTMSKAITQDIRRPSIEDSIIDTIKKIN